MGQRDDRCAAVRAACGYVLKAMLRLSGALLAACVFQSAIAQTSPGATAFTSLDPAAQTIRSRLAQRLSGLPKIDEISASGVGRHVS